VRLTGAIFLDAELGTPWGFKSPPTSATAHLLAPTAEHLVLFLLLVEGQAIARVPGHDSVPLGPGDIVFWLAATLTSSGTGRSAS
jgi:hypothetical protein